MFEPPQDADSLASALERALGRAGVVGPVSGLQRLSGGANMQSWLFDCGSARFVLRRAPSAEWMAGRDLTLADEAALIRAAHRAGVPAPEVVATLRPEDGLGHGFIMRAIPGSADPAQVLASEPGPLLGDIAAALAAIHAVDPASLPPLPLLDAAAGVEKLAAQFTNAGGDRPIIALGLAWLRRNVPAPVPPRLVHGDYRIGNLMAHEGRLSGVLDWELAHLGDSHEDLAFGCMTVWRFGRLDRPGFALGSQEDWFAAYEAAGGAPVDRARFRFWLVYRTVWWALGCLAMGLAWRERTDRSLERPVIARRTAEQELDLLLLLESEAPEAERARPLPAAPLARPEPVGEPCAAELLTAISEWLAATVKPRLEGRDRFDLAVAQNALGMVRRELAARPDPHDAGLAAAILAGEAGLETPGLLTRLRRSALDLCAADQPKYPTLPIAHSAWVCRN